MAQESELSCTHKDKSGDEVRPSWHRDPVPQPSYEEEQALILDHLLDEFPALMSFDERSGLLPIRYSARLLA